MSFASIPLYGWGPVTLAIMMVPVLTHGSAAAQDKTGSSPGTYMAEAWAGGDVTSKSWSIFSGGTWAPFGSLDGGGFRLRAAGGIGGFRYRSLRPNSAAPSAGGSVLLGVGTSAPRPPAGNGTQESAGKGRFGEALAGYQWRFNDLTLKAFAGIVVVASTPASFDPDATWAGQRTGAKIAVEAWYNVTPRLWSATDLGFATIEQSFSARQRIGFRILDQLSIGIDTGVRGQLETTYWIDSGINHARVGGLLRYEWPGGEISVTGGWALDRRSQSGTAFAPAGPQWTSGEPFATATVLMKF
jgi:hypothetical protein